MNIFHHLLELDLAWLEEQKQFSPWQVGVVGEVVRVSSVCEYWHTDTVLLGGRIVWDALDKYVAVAV